MTPALLSETRRMRDGRVRAEVTCRPATAPPRGPAPIWHAALLAACCQATGESGSHTIQWTCVSGRALYTNTGPTSELIQPLGLWLDGWHTLAVYWEPGETAYTTDVYPRGRYDKTGKTKHSALSAGI